MKGQEEGKEKNTFYLSVSIYIRDISWKITLQQRLIRNFYESSTPVIVFTKYEFKKDLIVFQFISISKLREPLFSSSQLILLLCPFS